MTEPMTDWTKVNGRDMRIVCEVRPFLDGHRLAVGASDRTAAGAWGISFPAGDMAFFEASAPDDPAMIAAGVAWLESRGVADAGARAKAAVAAFLAGRAAEGGTWDWLESQING